MPDYDGHQSNSNCLPIGWKNLFHPPPELDYFRDRAPLVRLDYPDGHVGWLVTSYPVARTILCDPRMSMRPIRAATGNHRVNSAALHELDQPPHRLGVFNFLDPPDHTRLRRTVAGHFSPRTVRTYDQQVNTIISDRIADIKELVTPLDFRSEFARPVSWLILCEILGIPKDYRASPDESHNDPTPAGTPSIQQAIRRQREWYRELVQTKSSNLENDLISDLIRNKHLSEYEVLGLTEQIIGAGHHTIATMLTAGMFVLLCNKKYWYGIQSGVIPVETAVEELLRYLSIFQINHTRTAKVDLEIDGVAIRAGESVTISLAAANRDPQKFREPNEFDPSRDAHGHLTFGHGIHVCLGQHLARLEIRAAITDLANNLPTLRLAVEPLEVSIDTSGELYQVEKLPATW